LIINILHENQFITCFNSNDHYICCLIDSNIDAKNKRRYNLLQLFSILSKI
jgi:hypothetical protein